MPKPTKGESQAEFISRAMRAFHDEGSNMSQKQMLGKAYGMYRNSKKKKKKMMMDMEDM